MNAWLAYLDPGSGSVVIQFFLGGVATLAVAAKLWWGRLLRLLHIRKPDVPEAAEPVSEADSA